MNFKFFLFRNTTKTIILLLTVISTVLTAYAQTGCDPQFIAALRDSGYEIVTNDVALTIMKNVCSGSTRSGGFDYVKDTTQFSGKAKSVEQACRTSDTKFFQNYRREIMYSRLPQGVLDGIANCFGESVNFSAMQNGDNITMRVGHRPIGTPPDKISSFTWSPKDAMTCDRKEWKNGFQLKVNSDVLTCRRIKNVPLTIDLNLIKGGGKSLFFTANPVFEKVSWKIEMNSNRKAFKCVNQFEEADKNWRNLESRFLIKHAVGKCYTSFGHSTVHYGDGKREYIKEEWSGRVLKKGKPLVQCILNGEDLDKHQFSVESEGGSSRPNMWGDICASLYPPIQGVNTN